MSIRLKKETARSLLVAEMRESVSGYFVDIHEHLVAKGVSGNGILSTMSMAHVDWVDGKIESSIGHLKKASRCGAPKQISEEIFWLSCVVFTVNFEDSVVTKKAMELDNVVK